MKLRNMVWVVGVLLLAGCVSVTPPRATVADGIIQNHSLGFFGFSFKIPDGFEIYNPAAKNPADCNELQRMAIRIYQLNEAYHPRDNELFYESFLLLSDQACFLLITIKHDNLPRLGDEPFSEQASLPWVLMPLYNPGETRTFKLGDSRFEAVYTRGHAYEQKGWYYAGQKRNSVQFNYEACKVTGGNRDSYVLMGFALPENAGALTAPTQQMIEGMKL